MHYFPLLCLSKHYHKTVWPLEIQIVIYTLNMNLNLKATALTFPFRALGAILLFFAVPLQAQIYNPYVGLATVSPAPMYNVVSGGTGVLSFQVGNSGTSPLPLVINQEMVLIITLSRGIPNNANPVAAIGGTMASRFNWLYDAVSKTYQGIQNQTIPDGSNGGVGTITIQYKVTSNSVSSSAQNGFNVNVTAPPYSNGINLPADDQVSAYTYTVMKYRPGVDYTLTQAGVTVTGNPRTNDAYETGTTYGNAVSNAQNPAALLPAINSNGSSYTFTPTLSGEYLFTVPVCEPSPMNTCSAVPLQINVLEPANTQAPPLANPDMAACIAGNTMSISVRSNDLCLGGTGCTLSLPTLVTPPAFAGSSAVVNANGTISYTAAAGLSGRDSFLYRVCDNASRCDSEWVFVNVLASGSPNSTLANDDVAITLKGVAVTGNVKTNDLDPEGNTQNITAQNTTLTGKGTFVLNSAGSYTFTPVSTFTGSLDIVYNACDNNATQACMTATLHILVTIPVDNDKDGIPDITDTDDDGDGIADTQDPYPTDTDNDLQPNWSDPDDDGDGINDVAETGSLAYDTDNDGMKNDNDTDDDGDGLPDTGEQGSINVSTGLYILPDADGDGLPDLVDKFSTNLSVKCFIQSFYSGGGLMRPVLANQLQPSTPGICDTITVELHSASSPYALVASAYKVIGQNGIVTCPFTVNAGNYYIVVKHRNALQTWSAAPVSLTTYNTGYDFTIAASQAYGSNMFAVEPGTWAFYSGDLVQDESIDLLDLSLIETDINSFGAGYIISDLNGDGNVDLLDLQNMEINIMSFIYSLHP